MHQGAEAAAVGAGACGRRHALDRHGRRGRLGWRGRRRGWASSARSWVCSVTVRATRVGTAPCGRCSRRRCCQRWWARMLASLLPAGLVDLEDLLLAQAHLVLPAKRQGVGVPPHHRVSPRSGWCWPGATASCERPRAARRARRPGCRRRRPGIPARAGAGAAGRGAGRGRGGGRRPSRAGADRRPPAPPADRGPGWRRRRSGGSTRRRRARPPRPRARPARRGCSRPAGPGTAPRSGSMWREGLPVWATVGSASTTTGNSRPLALCTVMMRTPSEPSSSTGASAASLRSA